LLILAGARGYVGAAQMAASGALAAGVGLVTLAVPEPILAEAALVDAGAMTRGLRATIDGTFAYPAAREALKLAGELAADAAALGPGLTKHPETIAFARRAAAELPVPCVVDADALNALALNVAGVPRPELRDAPAPRVFTPHPGEAGRILGRSAHAVQADRLGAVRDLQAKIGGVVLLKGRGTLVCDGRRLAINPTGNDGLAVGGSGDVLTGVIGALLARGVAPFEAACAGAYWHGAAADRIVEDRGAGPVRHRELCLEIETLAGA
jgi:NAD(P)H-hydrate epimerase